VRNSVVVDTPRWLSSAHRCFSRSSSTTLLTAVHGWHVGNFCNVDAQCGRQFAVISRRMSSFASWWVSDWFLSSRCVWFAVSIGKSELVCGRIRPFELRLMSFDKCVVCIHREWRISLARVEWHWFVTCYLNDLIYVTEWTSLFNTSFRRNRTDCLCRNHIFANKSGNCFQNLHCVSWVSCVWSTAIIARAAYRHTV